MQFYLALAIMFSLTIAIFAIQNSSLVTIQFLIWELPSVPQVIVIIFSALFGMIVAFLFGIMRQYKLSRQLSEMRDYTSTLEQEIIKLKPNSKDLTEN